jgi:predicted  nucleic acid-binding Zn-ribbon protein
MKEHSMKITTSHDVLLDLTRALGRLENELLAATIRIDNDAMEIARLTPLQYRQAPCYKFCEATAFNIEIRELKAELSKVTDELFALSQDDGKIERALDKANAEIARLKELLGGNQMIKPLAGLNLGVNFE